MNVFAVGIPGSRTKPRMKQDGLSLGGGSGAPHVHVWSEKYNLLVLPLVSLVWELGHRILA